MSYHFQNREKVAAGVRRIATSEISRILSLLRGRDGRRKVGRGEAVHEARKRFKKLRALLRLVRDPMGKTAYRRENENFRTCARTLSDARDAAVLIKAFDELLGGATAAGHSPACLSIRKTLVGRQRAAERATGSHAVNELTDSLRRAGERFQDQKLAGHGFNLIRAGLKRTFRRGRAGFALARVEPDAVNLHQWRKRVKDLLYQVELLEPVWPDVLRPFAEKLHALADQLGEDHDLAVLGETLNQLGADYGSDKAFKALRARLDARRRELQLAAMTLGERLYSEKPGEFVERMKSYWHAWRSGKSGAEAFK